MAMRPSSFFGLIAILGLANASPILAQPVTPKPTLPARSTPTKPPTPKPAPPKPANAPTGQTNSLAWTEAYATALEKQTDLVLRGQPLSGTLTRIELAQWLAEFFEYIPDRARAQPISDIEANSPDYWTAQGLLQAGVMRLYEGNQFRPNGNITKLEALAILVRALQLPAPSQPEIDSWMGLYSDATEVPAVGRAFVTMAGKAGMLVNVPDPKRLSPNQVLRRGEGAVLLHQTLVARNRIPALAPPVAQLSPTGIAAVPTTPATQLPTSPTTPPPSPPQNPTTGSQPEIFATRVQPTTGTVPVGIPLTVEIQATPGGQAVMDIGTTVRGIPMPEVNRGLYRAVYTPNSKDAILSPDISIQLTVAGVSTRIQQRQPQLALGNVAPPPVPSQPLPDPAFPPAPTPQPFAPQPLAPQPLPDATLADAPLFTGVRIRPERNLQEGDILTISVWGAAGALAQFDVGAFVVNQPLREVRPNLYEGTYVVAPTDRAVNPAVRIVMTKDSLSQQYQALFPFSVDGSVGTRSTIQQPTGSVPQGLPKIAQVSSNATNRLLRADDILVVTMRGDQGARATFQIANVTPEISMNEISPGLYEGKVRIDRGTPAVRNGQLDVFLDRSGQRSRQSLTEPININP